MAGRTIAIHFVRSALRGARERDLDVRPVLVRAGIPLALLDDPRARVTLEQYAELIRALWDALDDEFLGLGDFPCKRGTAAMMLLVALGSPDLATALRRAADFYALFPTEVRFHVRPGPESVRVEVALGGLRDPDHFVTECLLTVWHRVIGWAIGRTVPLARVEFAYPPPAHVAEYTSIFACPLSYGHPVTALVFDSAYLAAPLVQDEPGLWARMAAAPMDLINPPRAASSYRDRVRRILAHAYRNGPLPASSLNGTELGSVVVSGAATGRPQAAPQTIGLTEAAARLAVSPQTLRRHLQAEGTSFRAIREDVLRDAAIAALANGRQSVEEIAGRLGFADASAFHRAFKRWTGATPGAYRAIGAASNN